MMGMMDISEIRTVAVKVQDDSMSGLTENGRGL